MQTTVDRQDQPRLSQGHESQESSESGPIATSLKPQSSCDNTAGKTKCDNSTTDADTTAITNEEGGRRDNEDSALLDISPGICQPNGGHNRKMSYEIEPVNRSPLTNVTNDY